MRVWLVGVVTKVGGTRIVSVTGAEVTLPAALEAMTWYAAASLVEATAKFSVGRLAPSMGEPLRSQA